MRYSDRRIGPDDDKWEITRYCIMGIFCLSRILQTISNKFSPAMLSVFTFLLVCVLPHILTDRENMRFYVIYVVRNEKKMVKTLLRDI